MRGARGQILQADELVSGPPQPSAMILNHGDPAFTPSIKPNSHLSPAEALFLRVIAYVPFAEVVCIPVRYILGNQPTFEAVRMAAPLLEAGFLRPERRAEASSFEEVARLLGLPENSQARGRWLDAKAMASRSFNSIELSNHYRQILLDDLGDGGSFRYALTKKMRDSIESNLDNAQATYARTTNGTPEAFCQTVRLHAPQAATLALRWAMARYYTTPTIFDSINTREIPIAATKLLVKGRVLDESMQPLELPAPAEHLHTQLVLSLPIDGVSKYGAEYCRAAMEVRNRVPEARAVFTDVKRHATLGPLTDEVKNLFKEELAKQKRVKRLNGWAIAIGTTLGSTGIGLLVGGSPEVAGTVGVATGIAGKAADNKIQSFRDHRARPWLLASEMMLSNVKNGERE